MTQAQQTKLDALARTIVANPDRDPRFMIAETCKEDADFDYLDKKVDELEKAKS